MTASGSTVYESAKAVDEYLQFHFAPEADLAPYVARFVAKEALEFPKQCAKECALASSRRTRALDIGCAVGGSSFEMARYFDEVVGFDFSSAFIKAASDLQAKGSCTYESTIEGTIKESRVARVRHAHHYLPDGLRARRVTCLNGQVADGIERSRCKFLVGDACDIPALKLGEFDAVLAANLLCRLPNPSKFLRDVHDIVREGGVLVLVSPFSWLREYTEESKWIGGFTGQAPTVRTRPHPLYAHSPPYLLTLQ